MRELIVRLEYEPLADDFLAEPVLPPTLTKLEFDTQEYRFSTPSVLGALPMSLRELSCPPLPSLSIVQTCIAPLSALHTLRLGVDDDAFLEPLSRLTALTKLSVTFSSPDDECRRENLLYLPSTLVDLDLSLISSADLDLIPRGVTRLGCVCLITEAEHALLLPPSLLHLSIRMNTGQIDYSLRSQIIENFLAALPSSLLSLFFRSREQFSLDIGQKLPRGLQQCGAMNFELPSLPPSLGWTDWAKSLLGLPPPPLPPQPSESELILSTAQRFPPGCVVGLRFERDYESINAADVVEYCKDFSPRVGYRYLHRSYY